MTLSRRRSREFGLILAVLGLAAGLRGLGLAQQPLRGDEAFSVRFASLPLGTMWQALAVSEPNPPLQFLFLKGWMALAGDGEFALRWPSVLAGVLGVAAAYQAARAWAGAAAARWTALLLALSPFLIWYGQDLRIYAALAAATTAAGWATWLAARGRKKRRWAAAGLLWWLALNLHYFAAVTLLAAGLAFLITPATRRRWRPALVTTALVGLAELPWALYVLPLLEGHSKSWLAPVGAWELLTRTLIADSVGGRFAGAAEWMQVAGAALFGVLLLIGLIALWRKAWTRAVWLLALGPATPLLLGLISLYRPVYIEHYAVAGLPGAVMLAAGGLARLPRRAGQLLAAAGLAALALIAWSNYRFDPNYAKSPDWRGLAQYLRVTGQPDEVILVNLPDPAFAYYYRGPLAFEDAPPGPLAEVGVGAAQAQLTRLLGQYQHLRFLFAPSPGYDPDGWVGAQLTACCEKLADGFVGKFRVQAYDTPAGSLAARRPLAVSFENGLALTGYRLLPAPAGGDAHLTLYWTARQTVPADYTVFIHVLAADGFQLLGADGPPRTGTSRWKPGADVIDPRAIPLGDLPAGEYAVTIGLYLPGSDQRLTVLNADGTRADQLRLPEPLRVTAAP